MLKNGIFGFILRWAATSVAMYFCITWWGTVDAEAATIGDRWWVIYAIAGLIFSVINALVKPIVRLLALPLAILTLGLSAIIINVILVMITMHLLPGVSMEFWGIVGTSVILGVVNAVMNFVIG